MGGKLITMIQFNCNDNDIEAIKNNVEDFMGNCPFQSKVQYVFVKEDLMQKGEHKND